MADKDDNAAEEAEARKNKRLLLIPPLAFLVWAIIDAIMD